MQTVPLRLALSVSFADSSPKGRAKSVKKLLAERRMLLKQLKASFAQEAAFKWVLPYRYIT